MSTYEQEQRDRLDAERAAQKLHAQAHAVGLLNTLEATLTGWLLQFDRDELEGLTLGEISDRLDRD